MLKGEKLKTANNIAEKSALENYLQENNLLEVEQNAIIKYFQSKNIIPNEQDLEDLFCLGINLDTYKNDFIGISYLLYIDSIALSVSEQIEKLNTYEECENEVFLGYDIISKIQEGKKVIYIVFINKIKIKKDVK